MKRSIPEVMPETLATPEKDLPLAEDFKPEAFETEPAPEQFEPVPVLEVQGEKLAPEARQGGTPIAPVTEIDPENHYPRWKYSKDKPAQMVASKEAEKALKGTWYDVPQEGNVTTAAAPDPGFVPSIPVLSAEGVKVQRNHLLFQAEAIGLVVDGRWSNARLRREIHELASS